MKFHRRHRVRVFAYLRARFFQNRLLLRIVLTDETKYEKYDEINLYKSSWLSDKEVRFVC